jgi:RluA family pseudouridine synthase
MTIPIIFQDDALLVVDKPPGMPVLPDGWIKNSPYLFQILTEQFGKIFLVHRLDKQTSGILLFAKTPDAHKGLSLQFERHQVQKTYLAILTGKVFWDDITCNLPLRVNAGHGHRTIVDYIIGKPSETVFHVVEKYSGHTLVEVRPKSGRTHQIRAHACALGHSITGDVLYHSTDEGIISRPALHAQALTFSHPISHKTMTLSASPPKDFLDAVKIIRFQG